MQALLQGNEGATSRKADDGNRTTERESRKCRRKENTQERVYEMLPLKAGLQAIQARETDRDLRTKLICAKCRALLRGYAVRWKPEILVPYAVEQIRSADLINPSTQRKSKELK